MKHLYSVNNMISRECIENGPRMDRVKSRITSIRPALTMLMLLMVCLFGVNESALGAWEGSGEAVSHNGSTYYVYDLSTEKSKTAGGLISVYFDELSLSGPGATVSFQAKRVVSGTGNLVLQQYNGSWSDVWSNGLGLSYSSYSQAINNNSTKIQFYIPSGSLKKYYKNLKVTMAQYIENPSPATSESSRLDCGTADVNSDATTGDVTVQWCNVPAMSYEIENDAKGLFSVSVANNSEAGKYNTATFTVSYKHTEVGTHKATLKITDTYNGYSQKVYLTGTTNKKTPTVAWNPSEKTFNVDDVLSATSAPGTTVVLSVASGDAAYVNCSGNTATILAPKTDSVLITATITGNETYYNASYTRNIWITTKEKQTISWSQDYALAHFKTTDATKSLELNATASSGLPVSYELVGNKTGLTLTQSGNKWILTYSASECVNTMLVAKQAGNEVYAAASSISFPVKVIDPTQTCGTSETLINSSVTLRMDERKYDIEIPASLSISISRTSNYLSYSNGFKIEFYSEKQCGGTLLKNVSYTKNDISNSKSDVIDLTDCIHAKSVKIISEALNGYDVTSLSYTKRKYHTIDASSLNLETSPNSESSTKTVKVGYANYPISLECSNPNFTFTPEEFGDCGAYGLQTVSVTYKAGADEGEDGGYLYVLDNTGATLETCTLYVTISKVGQSITSTSIQSSYNTTDRIELSAEANSGLTEFEYSASPAGIASFADNVMTFSQNGTIAITATQPGSNVYAAASTTVENVKVNKVTPTIATNPSVSEIKYKDNLINGEGTQLSNGLATVTLRGVDDTKVEGTFTWTNPGQVTNGVGNHDYQITFTPTNGGMYKDTTFTQSVAISRADGGIEMNNGEVKVKIAGINDDLNECKIDLDDLVEEKIEDAVASRAGTVSFKVISDNKTFAAIDGDNKFSATKVGTYTIRATQAETNYYEADSVEFTVTVNKLVPTIVFDNTDNPEYVYSGDVIEQPAARMYNGKVIDRNVEYVSSDPSLTGAIHVDGTTLTARNVTAPEGSAVEVTITASTDADALYEEASVSATHNYAVRAKRSPVFTMDTYVNENGSKTLNIGDQAIITYNENTNEFLTVGTASEHAYVTFVHDKVNRTITVTAVKGTVTGDGVQEIIVNQPGNERLFERKNITYTFTVKRNVSALSLDPLTTSMEVEDTVTSIYSGLANTTDGLQFSCSPEGSMKMENGKLIALQAGTSTVTFSQPATEYWTGISMSKTITVSKKNPNMTTQLGTRHPWYSIIEHPFSSLNTEKTLSITSSNESLAKYIAEEDKIYVYGTSGNVTFTVNQAENYKYNAVVNYQKTFEIFQPNNRLPFTLTSSNFSDYKSGNSKNTNVEWNGGGVVVGSASLMSGATDWSDKYIILKFVGVPDKLSFSFENTIGIATQYGWHFYQSSNGSDWNLIKEYQDLLMNATGGTSEGTESNLPLNPATQYIKLEYHGNYGGRFTNVSVTERKEIAPKDATKDFGLGYNGNEPTLRTIKVDWYNVKPCTVTIIGTDADKFVLDEGSKTINSQLDHFGTVDLLVSYKHETNTETTHTATLHIEDVDGNYANVTLTGQTTPAPQTIIWRSDLTPMPSEGSFQNAAMVTTGQAVTLVSDHPEIVRVVDNTTLEPVSAGTARVTATAAGNDKWAETTDYIDIEVTNLKVQYITWPDNLSNRKREDGQTVEIELHASSSADLPITYELDEATQAFASISGNVLSLTGWGSGQVIAKQVGNEEYVAVQATKTLVSRNPNAKCRPLVGEYNAEYTLHTLAEKIIPLNGEPDSVTFWAKCDASALWGMWVAEEYDGFYHDVQEISRLGDPNITSSYQHYSFPLHRNATAVKLYTKTGATMTRTFKEMEVPLAKYLELAENTMNFSQVDKGSTKTQSFYINYSNLTGVLDVEMETTENTHFTVVTTTVGEDCGEIGQYVRIDISYTGTTLGNEENAILVHNADQSLRIPVTASVVLPSQTITWDQELNVLTTDHVVLSATATSELPVSFTSGNTDIAEVVYEAGVYSLNIKSYNDVEITAHQAGNEDWSAATDKTLTFHISRVVPTILTNPTATGVVLPNTLAASTLEGGSVDGGIAGTFRWQDATISVSKGVATYTAVFDPENDDWYETVPVEVAVPILKTPQTITWNRANESEEGCSDVVILDATASSGLPITYHSSDSTKAYAIDAVVNEVAVKKLYILKGGDVTITAEQKGDETYAAAPSVSKTITLVRVLPTIETLPTATFMYVHHFLSNSTPQGGVVKAGENTVTGVFNWANGSEVMDVPGTNQRTVVFRPYNSDFYQEVSAVIDVEVHRFAPTVIHSFTTETKVYGTKLSEFVLNGEGHGYDYTDPAHYEIAGTFAWKDENHIPSVSETTAVMVFHPDHTEWYDDVEFNVPITITQAAIVSATATATMYYGQILGDAILTNTTIGIVKGTTGVVAGTVSWDSSLDLMEYYTEGTYPNLPIRFTPTDPNYEATEIAGTAVLTVEAGYVFDGNVSKTWTDDANWRDNEAPENINNEKVVILADVEITGMVTVDALTIKDDVTVTVKDGATLTIGSSDSYVREGYGNLHVENGGKVILNEGELKVNNFVLEASIGDMSRSASSGQVNGEEQLTVEGNAYFQICFDPVAISYGWYDFVLPFDVDVNGGIYLASDTTTPLVNNVDFAIMAFSEARRAQNTKPWTWFSGTLKAGQLYTITLDETKPARTTYIFKKKAGAELGAADTYNAECTGSDANSGWNGIGNGTLRYCQLNSLPAEAKMQVYDHTDDRYIACEAVEYTYAVGTAFFIQATENQEITLDSVRDVRDFRAPSRVSRTVSEFRLGLKPENAERAVDHMWVSASEDATGEYTIGHDLIKMGTPTSAKVAQMWSERNGQKLCDIEMPLVNDKASCGLNIYAPKAGTYTLDIERAPEDATLYLTYNGYLIWNLTASPYELELEKGTTSSYGLRIVNAPLVTTDVENGESLNGENGVRKVLIDNVIYLITPEGKMYDIVGKGVKF